MRKFKYITDKMLKRLDGLNDNLFSQQFVLINEFGLSGMQADRVIRYWRGIRQIERLEKSA